MEQLEILSRTVFDVIKEFSTGKRSLSALNLMEAFSSREEILSLISPDLNASPIEKDREALATGRQIAETWQDEILADLSGLRDAFSKILESLGPVITSGYEVPFTKLQKKINTCESFLQFGLIGELIGKFVGHLIDDAVERIDYSNDFLVELSKDLYKMEEQLLCYQDGNKEANVQSRDFHDNLILHADEMHRAFDSGKSITDIRQLITSKISIIYKTIEAKRQLDEARLRETDTKMAELQNNLRTYSQEILQVRERADSLEKEVLLDQLTQVNNRRAYDLQLKENLRRYHRSGGQFSLILIDIDNFKRVNDDYGHKAGDKCLQEIAKLIKTSLRKADFLARYGGEELITILDGTSAEDGRKIAENIRSRIERARFSYQQREIPITISLGVTEVMQTDEDLETPFIRADNAMYQAKSQGRNRVCVG